MVLPDYWRDLEELDKIIIRGIRQAGPIHTPTIERRIIILRALGKLTPARKAMRRTKPYSAFEMEVYAAVLSLQGKDAYLTQTRAYRYVKAKGLYGGSRQAFCKLLAKLNVSVHPQPAITGEHLQLKHSRNDNLSLRPFKIAPT